MPDHSTQPKESTNISGYIISIVELGTYLLKLYKLPIPTSFYINSPKALDSIQ